MWQYHLAITTQHICGIIGDILQQNFQTVQKNISIATDLFLSIAILSVAIR
jgi:hypothetical protein